jgi:hypothetical protein
MNNIKQVVLWGHKLHSHTHSYIHNAFYIAFKHLGYKTLWLDNKDNYETKDFSQPLFLNENNEINTIDFTNTLFITEGQVDQNIPILSTAYYILHNCNMDKYSSKTNMHTFMFFLLRDTVVISLYLYSGFYSQTL